MQYRANEKPGFILAIAEDQQTVGKSNLRANYYTSKTVIYNPDALRQLVRQLN